MGRGTDTPQPPALPKSHAVDAAFARAREVGWHSRKLRAVGVHVRRRLSWAGPRGGSPKSLVHCPRPASACAPQPSAALRIRPLALRIRFRPRPFTPRVRFRARPFAPASVFARVRFRPRPFSPASVCARVRLPPRPSALQMVRAASESMCLHEQAGTSLTLQWTCPPKTRPKRMSVLG
jgi:hypothetical protein